MVTVAYAYSARLSRRAVLSQRDDMTKENDLPIHPNGRKSLSAKVLAVILLSSLIPWGFCQAAGTPDSFVKWRHFEEAQAIADRDDKLLIVVQGPDDCSIDLQECIFPREFAGSAFPDNGHSAFYEFRAVLSYRQSGKVQIQARKVDDKQRAKSRIARRNRGNVLTYFCTPEGKVLHFLVGFPTPELMQAETDWSFQLLRRLDGLTRYERATAVKEAHQRRLAERTIGPMANWSALLSNDMTGRPSLIKLAVSVAKQRDQLILRAIWHGMDVARETRSCHDSA